MKSLYSCIRESIFDDDITISNQADSEIYQELLKNIMNSKSFKEYENRISELKDLLKDNAVLVSDDNKKSIRFKNNGIYLILLYKTSYEGMDNLTKHSRIYIGRAILNTTYIISGFENPAAPQYNWIKNDINNKSIKYHYKDTCAAANSWMRNSNICAYKIDGTKFEGLLKCITDLGEQTRRNIK